MTIRSQKGFSLLEVLIAMGIFAIGSLAALALTTAIFRTSQDAEMLTEVANAGRAEMERIMSESSTTTPALANASCIGTSAPANFATCSSTAASMDCCRVVSASANGTPINFQVDNFRKVVGGAVVVQVEVRYPMNRDLRKLKPGDTGFVDCLVTPENCHAIILNDQKPNQ